MKKADWAAEKRPSCRARMRARLDGFSIRSRIFFYFLLFTALLLVLLWVFQTVLLDDFYRFQKTAMLGAVADTLAGNIENPELQALVTRVSEENEVCVLIVGDDYSMMATAEAGPGCAIHRMGPLELLRLMATTGQGPENTVFKVLRVEGFRNSQYDAGRFVGRVPLSTRGEVKSMIATRQVTLSGGQQAYLFLNAVITPVNATVDTLRHQLLFISGILVLLSFLLSMVLTRRITQPILATKEAAKELPVGRFAPAKTPVSYREVEELNHQLTQAAQDLCKVEAMQRELMANISHDLRTPLTLMEGYAEAMRDIPGENTPENVQVILDEAKRLSTLVNAVLSYSAGKNGGQPAKREVFDLTSEILAILQRYQKLTQQDGYQVRFDFDRHVSVCADPTQVGQVVYNLINNALTYTGEDKTVTVTQSVDQGQVKIQVRDSGEGIAPEELPSIWGRYYRGQKPHKRAAIGTGLGLSIVQSILDSHHLDYGVESQVGSGSVFWFCLPVA